MASSEVHRTFRDGRMTAATVTAETLSARLTPALRRAFVDARHGAKRLARAASVSPRCASNWLDGLNAPRAAELLRLMAECEDIATEINALIAEQRAART